MAVDEARLRKVLGGKDTEWLVDRIRERLAAGKPLTGTVRLRNPSAAQRVAVERLLGRRTGNADTIGMRLDRLDDVLRDSGIHTGGLAAAVTVLTGPITVRAEALAASERAWSESLARGAGVADRVPRLRPWWERMTATGVIRRVAGDPATAADLLDDAVTVLDELPVRRELIGVFAARVLGSAHALDPDRPVSGVVLSMLRTLSALPDDTDRRTVWRSAGIIVDELSSTVLTAGLTATSEHTGRAVNSWREAGQPVVLTLRQLDTGTPEFITYGAVYVCENPAVVATAADRLGPGCPPIVCTQGQPGAAAIELLDLLTTAGATLYYHGDFDWYGITIANVLHRRYDLHPWRFTAADYTAISTPHRTMPLTGTPVDARWDHDLADSMRRRGIQIEEELVLDELMADLRSGPNDEQPHTTQRQDN